MNEKKKYYLIILLNFLAAAMLNSMYLFIYSLQVLSRSTFYFGD